MAALIRKKKKKEEEGGGDGWLTTFADMIMLLLVFFCMLFNPAVDNQDELLNAISTYFSSLDWGYSLSPGRVATSGNTFADLPSQTRGRVLGDALRRAISLFNPEIRSNQVKVTQDERGVVISFASDVFFQSASATLNIDAARTILFNLATLLSSEEVAGRSFRIEGHTDASPVDPAGPWVSNWQLSTERALSVLYYLVDLGVPEDRMQVAGFGSTKPITTNATREGRTYNRRVDVIIIDNAHL
ncbi:MAG: flagellar motor protein MotB [Treponema sp.]|nr:flagellar motor protein MotB [Treponema sp.]